MPKLPKTGKANKGKILEFIPTGYRYMDHEIVEEQSKNVIGKHGDDEFRLYKLGGHPYTSGKGEVLWPTTEGNLFAAVIDEEEKPYITLGELLEDVWGQKGIVEKLNEQAPELAEPLKQRWLTPVTVRAATVDPEAKKAIDKLVANEMLHDSNIRQAGEVGTYEKERSKQDIILDYIIKIGFGAGIWEIVRKFVMKV